MAVQMANPQRELEANEKQRQALELRKGGVSYAAIATRLGYRGASGAWHAVRAALRKTLQEPADELRQLELERLDGMLLGIAPQVSRGNFGAIDRALKIMERRARLLGLDAPVKVAPTNPAGDKPYSAEDLSDDDLARIAHGGDKPARSGGGTPDPETGPA